MKPSDTPVAFRALQRPENQQELHPDSAFPLKIVIVYDDISAGRRAMSMLTKLLQEDDHAVQLLPRLWRFNLLDDPAWQAEAWADAAGADLLVLSSSSPAALPPVIENWVSAFLARRRGTSTAILALLGLEDEWRISVQEPVGADRLPPLGRTEIPVLSQVTSTLAACF